LQDCHLALALSFEVGLESQLPLPECLCAHGVQTQIRDVRATFIHHFVDARAWPLINKLSGC
jgi:hypothetical protein